MKKLFVLFIVLILLPLVLASDGRSLESFYGGYYGGYKNINQQVVKEGYPINIGRITKDMKGRLMEVNSVILFDVKGGDFSLEIISIDNDERTIELFVNNVYYKIIMEDYEKIDLEDDGVYDLLINFHGILKNRFADISLSLINERYNEIIEGDDEWLEKAKDKLNTPPVSMEISKNNNLNIIIGFVGVILLIVIVVWYTYKKNKEDDKL